MIDFNAIDLELKERLNGLTLANISGEYLILYPDGVVRGIHFSGTYMYSAEGHFEISDKGATYAAARDLGVFYDKKYAKEAVKKYSIDCHDIFYSKKNIYSDVDIVESYLVANIINIANASKYVVELLMEEAEKRKGKALNP